ncbi:unnamed protein product [Caenorhabditis bovis]|uniref:glucuronosyltransferase n=1 Tax=Caenorhabditis bovis TaxID=2654633 RepID=A0A8S1E5J8_9PELO|nr:unnamed protein product [Caenorhabditis bovis]
MCQLLLLFLLFALQFVDSAKVILTVMDQGRSHASSITPFMHRLQKDNHTTVLEFTSYHDDIDFGIEERFINMSGYQNEFQSPDFFKIAFEGEFNFLHQPVPYMFGSISCDRVLKFRRERFFEILNEDWDLFLSDSLFAVCGYGMAQLSGKHHVLMHSSDVESSHGSYKGFHRNYAITVPNFLPYSMPDFTVQSYIHRAYSTLDWFGGMFMTVVASGIPMKWALRSVIGFPYFSFYDYVRTSTFSFTDMPEALYPPGARTNDFFSYGSYCSPVKGGLNDEFSSFVNDPNSKGTILVAFGTLIDWRHAPVEKLRIFVNTLNQLKEYRVIWSMKGDRPAELLDHVKTSSWIPQNALLHHNKTKLFVSHGGLKSVKEAACSATPSIFLPMFGEQMRNAWLAKTQGFARILNKFHLSVEYFERNIREVLDHPDYQLNADKLFSRFLDQPIPTLDEAAHKFNRHGPYNPQPHIPNNNLAIGYPTAYGLYAGRGYGNNNWNNGWNEGGGNLPPNAGTGFGSPLRCLNGGAHIGQCRLDKDSICVALGGSCIHGACCTTPFVSIMGVASTVKPDVIEGDATRKTRKITRQTTTTTHAPDDDEGDDVIDSKEMAEWNRLVESYRTSTQPSTTTTTQAVTVTPVDEEEGEGESDNKMCDSGLKPVGPCTDDSDCPTLHQCENEKCCYLVIS